MNTLDGTIACGRVAIVSPSISTFFDFASGDANRCHRFGRAIQAGRVWTNCYHAYPAHAAFGGYKQSGIGRETHKMMLDHYQQTKNLLVSYSPKKLGFFERATSRRRKAMGLYRVHCPFLGPENTGTVFRAVYASR